MSGVFVIIGSSLERRTMNYLLAGATERQQNFILTLAQEREYELTEIINSPKEASDLISKLLKMPKKVQKVHDPELSEALSKVIKSKYAVPVEELILDFYDENIDNDLLFVEVREYQGHLYLRRLHGSVGSFVRSKLSRKDTLAILGHIAQDPYKYAKLFGEHYSCCGKCGAELTDAVSRKLQLGPDCRKAFGF